MMQRHCGPLPCCYPPQLPRCPIYACQPPCHSPICCICAPTGPTGPTGQTGATGQAPTALLGSVNSATTMEFGGVSFVIPGGQNSVQWQCFTSGNVATVGIMIYLIGDPTYSSVNNGVWSISLTGCPVPVSGATGPTNLILGQFPVGSNLPTAFYSSSAFGGYTQLWANNYTSSVPSASNLVLSFSGFSNYIRGSLMSTEFTTSTSFLFIQGLLTYTF